MAACRCVPLDGSFPRALSHLALIKNDTLRRELPTIFDSLAVQTFSGCLRALREKEREQTEARLLSFSPPRPSCFMFCTNENELKAAKT